MARQCTLCGQHLDDTMFYKGQYRCKACFKKSYQDTEKGRQSAARASKKWNESEKGIAYKQSDAYKQRHRDSCAKWYSNDANRQKHINQSKRWASENKARRQDASRASALKRRLGGDRPSNRLFIEDWAMALNYFDNLCAYCGSSAPLEQDHVVPISKGGSSSIDNIMPACKRCNSSKCTTEMLSWYKRQPFFNQERLDKILRYLQEVINV